MSEQSKRMPADVLWFPAWVVMLVATLFALLIWALNEKDRVYDATKANDALGFKQELFLHIAGIKKAGSDLRPIGEYLKANSSRLDEVINQENLLRYSSSDGRAALHFEHPEVVVKPLVDLAEDWRWKALRNNKEDLATLRALLNGSNIVPDVTYTHAQWRMSTKTLWLIIVIIQLCGCAAFFLRWRCDTVNSDRNSPYLSEVYHWCDFSWPARASMLFMIPGGLLLFVPAFFVSCFKGLKQRRAKSSTHPQREHALHLFSAFAYKHPTHSTKQLLGKLEKRVQSRDT